MKAQRGFSSVIHNIFIVNNPIRKVIWFSGLVTQRPWIIPCPRLGVGAAWVAYHILVDVWDDGADIIWMFWGTTGTGYADRSTPGGASPSRAMRGCNALGFCS